MINKNFERVITMKKYLSVVLAVIIAVSLASCGSGSSSETSAAATKNPAVTTAASVSVADESESYTDAQGNIVYAQKTTVKSADADTTSGMALSAVVTAADSTTVTVAVMAQNISQFASCDFLLGFDKTKLSIASIKKISDEGYYAEANDQNDGTIKFSGFVLENAQVVNTAFMTVVFNISSGAAVGDDLTFKVTIKDFTVGDSTHVTKKVAANPATFTVGTTV